MTSNFFLAQLMRFCSSENFFRPGRFQIGRNFLCEISATSQMSTEVRCFVGLGNPDTTVRSATGREWVKIHQIYLIGPPPTHIVLSMCGHQSSDHGLRNNGRNFYRHPIWGCLRPFWDKIWPKYKISGTILNDPVKLPRWLNLLKNAQKGLGGSICTLQAHSKTTSQTPKI